jgi:hypothetical protein
MWPRVCAAAQHHRIGQPRQNDEDCAIAMVMSTAVRNCATRSSSMRFSLSEADQAMIAQTDRIDSTTMLEFGADLEPAPNHIGL